MMAIVAPLLFLCAFAFACATITTMLASHGGKMITALRMDCRTCRNDSARRPTPVYPRREAQPVRAVRQPLMIGMLRAA